MILTEQERGSELWAKLKADAEARLAKLRQDNDADKDPIATAKLRGQIAECKRFIDQGAIKARIEVE